MFGSKRVILLSLVASLSFTSGATFASMQVMHTLNFPDSSETVTTQSDTVVKIEECKNNEQCATLNAGKVSK